jgi:hypothetical protein
MPSPNMTTRGKIRWLGASSNRVLVQLDTGDLFFLENDSRPASRSLIDFMPLFRGAAASGRPVSISTPRVDSGRIVAVEM